MRTSLSPGGAKFQSSRCAPVHLGPICRLLLAGSARSGFTGLLEYDAVAIPQPPPRLLSPPSFSPLSLEHAVQPSGLRSWGPSYPSSLISGPTDTLNCIISLGLSLCRLLSFEATRSPPPPHQFLLDQPQLGSRARLFQRALPDHLPPLCAPSLGFLVSRHF